MPVLHPEWLVPAEFPALAAEEVHVWLSVLPAAEESVSQLARLLSPDEQARAARFHFPKDRAAFVTARGRLRMLLGRYLRTAPEKIQFILNAHGKPELPSRRRSSSTSRIPANSPPSPSPATTAWASMSSRCVRILRATRWRSGFCAG